MNRTAVGVDIAKNVFQLDYIDQDTGEIVNKPIKRAKFLEHFANRAPCLIGMEACGGAHHWARLSFPRFFAFQRSGVMQPYPLSAEPQASLA
ncbi:hypothetical protein QF000_000613 [Paraburkholderia atlantica]